MERAVVLQSNLVQQRVGWPAHLRASETIDFSLEFPFQIIFCLPYEKFRFLLWHVCVIMIMGISVESQLMSFAQQALDRAWMVVGKNQCCEESRFRVVSFQHDQEIQ